MKTKDLAAKTAAELDKLTLELRRQIVTTKIDLRTKEVKNPLAVRSLRRDLARTLTLRRAAELKAAEVTRG